MSESNRSYVRSVKRKTPPAPRSLRSKAGRDGLNQVVSLLRQRIGAGVHPRAE